MTKKIAPNTLTVEEIEQHQGTIYVPGQAYQWILTYGWVLIGFYIEHLTPIRIRVAHANYYLQSERSHAEVAHNNGGDIKWRYWGDFEITTGHVIGVTSCMTEVPRSPVASR